MTADTSKMESAFGVLLDSIDTRAREVAEETALATIEKHQATQKKEVNQRVTGKFAAKHFGMSYPTFLKRRNEKGFPYIRLGNKTLYDLEELENFLKNMRR